MDRALARSRLHRFIAQALLGLLLFAWLPVAEGASSPFLNDPGQVLSLTELPDGAEADGEVHHIWVIGTVSKVPVTPNDGPSGGMFTP